MKFGRNLWLLCLGIAATLIGAALTAAIVTSGDDVDNRALAVPTAVISLAASKAEDVPLYPGAEEIKRDDRGLPVMRDTVYYVKASRQEVFEFYTHTLLLKDGWTIRSRNGNESRQYLWKDPNKVTPWRISLYIQAGIPVSRADRGRTTVLVSIVRWPDPARIPLYADAQGVITDERIHRDNNPDLERSYTTSYKTDATPDQVNTYYRATLPHYGWTMDDKGDSSLWSLVPRGLQLSYDFGGPEGMSSGVVQVLAIGFEGKTQVKIASIEFGVP